MVLSTVLFFRCLYAVLLSSRAVPAPFGWFTVLWVSGLSSSDLLVASLSFSFSSFLGGGWCYFTSVFTILTEFIWFHALCNLNTILLYFLCYIFIIVFIYYIIFIYIFFICITCEQHLFTVVWYKLALSQMVRHWKGLQYQKRLKSSWARYSFSHWRAE